MTVGRTAKVRHMSGRQGLGIIKGGPDATKRRSGARESRSPDLAARLERLKGFAVFIVLLVVLIGGWQVTVMRGWVPSFVLPAPTDVIGALRADLGLGSRPGFLLSDVGITLREMLLGFTAGVTAGLAVGTLLGYVKWLRQGALPFVIFLQSFPKVAIAPLLVTWLGFDLLPKVALGGLLAFFPVLVNTIAGISEVDENELALVRSLGANPVQELWYLRAPNSMIYVFSALDIAAAVSLIGVVVGEFVGARAGLGYRILERAAVGDVNSVFAALLLLGMLGSTLFLIVRIVRSRVLRWNE